MSSSPTRAASKSSIAVVMPQMGVSVTEGTVTVWLKSPGDPIAADETICEVTTDKIDVEIPAPVAGRLAEILVGVGGRGRDAADGRLGDRGHGDRVAAHAG